MRKLRELNKPPNFLTFIKDLPVPIKLSQFKKVMICLWSVGILIQIAVIFTLDGPLPSILTTRIKYYVEVTLIACDNFRKTSFDLDF